MKIPASCSVESCMTSCRLSCFGHLSKENNLPEPAYEAVRMEITMGENPYRAEDFRMMVADRSNVSPVINIA